LLASLIAINRPRIVEVQEVERECPTVKTFSFHDKSCRKAKPGQFVMVWVPGVDEIPLSLSTTRPDGYSSVTVAEVGEATKALHRRERGDLLGLRGPYGNGFAPAGGSALIVGGGTGLAPLVPLAEELIRLPTKITFLLGAKTRDELLFLGRIGAILSNRASARVIAATEDGSHGLKGLATDLARQELVKGKFDMIYTCGPEPMMREMFLLAGRYNAPLQASLERLMRCAIGLCGSCVIGRFRVCRDGPVFTMEQLRDVGGEFGKFRRDLSGRKVRI